MQLPIEQLIKEELLRSTSIQATLSHTSNIDELVHSISKLRVMQVTEIDLQVAIPELIKAFENGEERFNRDATFRATIQSISQGTNAFHLINSLLTTIKGLQAINENLVNNAMYAGPIGTKSKPKPPTIKIGRPTPMPRKLPEWDEICAKVNDPPKIHIKRGDVIALKESIISKAYNRLKNIEFKFRF